MEIPWMDMIKIAAAFVAGFILGFEREYRDKPAGLRTIILITVGSALFSLLNLTFDTASPDRIASNVVTGVGFVGAGVIFKEGMNVKGLTSAATIWVAAAIGMAIGFGNYWLAATTLLLTLIVLTILQRFEQNLESKKRCREFRITFNASKFSLGELEKELDLHRFSSNRGKIKVSGEQLTVEYQAKISTVKFDELVQLIVRNNDFVEFEEL